MWFLDKTQAEADLDYYFNKAVCELEVGAFNYDREPGPPRQHWDLSDRTFNAAERVYPIRQALLRTSRRNQKIITLRFTEHAWRGTEFNDWWTKYERFAMVVKKLVREVDPDTDTARLLAARELVEKAVEAYVKAKKELASAAKQPPAA